MNSATVNDSAHAESTRSTPQRNYLQLLDAYAPAAEHASAAVAS